MKVLKKGCVRKLAVERYAFYKNGLLVAQDPWLPKNAWKSVKAKRGAHLKHLISKLGH